MLRRISSNKESFVPITFGPGFNIVLAERSPEATDTHSRNARGKTTLLQVINYCLGGNLPNSLRPLVNDEWEFTLRLDLFGDQVSATRALKGGGRVGIEYGTTSAGVLDSFVDENGSVALADWKFLLGLGLFGLDVENEESSMRLSPRTLLSYVVRLEALKDPLKVFSQQPAWSWREHIAFLLGLDWRNVRDLAKIAKEQDTFKALQYASSERLLPGLLRQEPDILLERAQAQRQVDELRQRIDAFHVIDDPDLVLQRADRITEQLRELRDSSLIDRRLLELYRESLDEEDGSSDNREDLQNIYDEMGQTFSRNALRRLEEVEAFHNQLMSNRRLFLRSEIEKISTIENDRQEEMRRLSAERNNLMAIISAGGALEELNSLHSQLNDASNRLAELDAALNSVRELASAQEDSRLRRAQMRQEVGRELTLNRAQLDQVAGRFDAMMRRLYGRSGVLTAEVDDLGFKFSLKVAGVASTGVTRMQMLCFDLTLLAENPTWTRHPDFLVHDSVVFDGVDPRQVEAGLALAHETVGGLNAQYICTMNSNDVPENIGKQEWFIDGSRHTVFDTDEGGILGVTF